MLLREDKLSEIAGELNEEREARGTNVAPSAQTMASTRTAATTAADAERTRASKAEKNAAHKLKKEQDKAAKKLVADAKKGGGGGGGAGQVGGNAETRRQQSSPHNRATTLYATVRAVVAMRASSATIWRCATQRRQYRQHRWQCGSRSGMIESARNVAATLRREGGS